MTKYKFTSTYQTLFHPHQTVKILLIVFYEIHNYTSHILPRKSAYQFITPWKEAVQVSLDSPSFTLNMNQSGFCIRTHSSWCRQLHTSVTGQSTGFVVLSLHNIQCITRNFKCLLLVQGRLLPYYGAFFWKKPLPWIRKWWYAFYFTPYCLCSVFSELSKREKHFKKYDDAFYNLRVDGAHKDKDSVLQILFAWHPNIINCLHQKIDEVLYLYVAFYFN